MKEELPGRIEMPNGQVYIPVLLKCQSSYDNGCPEDCTLYPKDQTIEVTGGEKFFLAYVCEGLLHTVPTESESKRLSLRN